MSKDHSKTTKSRPRLKSVKLQDSQTQNGNGNESSKEPASSLAVKAGLKMGTKPELGIEYRRESASIDVPQLEYHERLAIIRELIENINALRDELKAHLEALK